MNPNIDIELYLGDKNLGKKGVIYKVKKDQIPSPEIIIHNKSFKLFDPGDYRIGVITDENYVRLRSYNASEEGVKTTKLPSGRNLHMCRIIEDILYPDSYTSLTILLEPFTTYNRNSPYGEVDYQYREEQEIIIRVFTPTGTRDFYLTIKPED